MDDKEKMLTDFGKFLLEDWHGDFCDERDLQKAVTTYLKKDASLTIHICDKCGRETDFVKPRENPCCKD